MGFKDHGSTAISVRVNGIEWEDVETIELLFSGDCERETFIGALRFALARLTGKYLPKNTMPYHNDEDHKSTITVP